LAFIKELNKKYTEMWNKEKDLTRLKTLKLLFLTVWAYKIKDKSILNVFNRFEAWKYGPVEVDVYNELRNFKNTETVWWKNIDKIIKGVEVNDIDHNVNKKMKLALNSLIEKNPNIINYSSSELVDVVHKWDAWSIPYGFWKKNLSLKNFF